MRFGELSALDDLVRATAVAVERSNDVVISDLERMFDLFVHEFKKANPHEAPTLGGLKQAVNEYYDQKGYKKGVSAYKRRIEMVFKPHLLAALERREEGTAKLTYPGSALFNKADEISNSFFYVVNRGNGEREAFDGFYQEVRDLLKGYTSEDDVRVRNAFDNNPSKEKNEQWLQSAAGRRYDFDSREHLEMARDVARIALVAKGDYQVRDALYDITSQLNKYEIQYEQAKERISSLAKSVVHAST